jgi:hypothetical protein
MKMILQPTQRIVPCICRSQLRNRLPCIYISRFRSDTQSNYSQVSGASSNWEDTDYDDRGDRASNATEAHQRHQWQQQQTQQQQQQTLQPPDAERIPKKVTYAQQLVQSVFPQVMSLLVLSAPSYSVSSGCSCCGLVVRLRCRSGGDWRCCCGCESSAVNKVYEAAMIYVFIGSSGVTKVSLCKSQCLQ